MINENSIGVWDAENFDKTFSALLVRRDDLEAYYSIEEDIDAPQDIYIVEPNGYEIIELLVCYISLLSGKVSIIVDNDFSFDYGRFIASINGGNIEAAKDCVNKIKKYIPLRFKTFHDINNYILFFSEKIIWEMFSRTAYVANNNSDMERSDLRLNSEYVDVLSLVLDASIQVESVHPNIDLKYKVAISSLKKLLINIKSDDSSKSFFYMSLYFFVLSKVNCLKSSYGASVLLMFRAIECFFISLGFKEGSLVNVGGEVRYFDDNNSDVYLGGLIKKLPRLQNIIFDRNTKDFIFDLKAVRNKMYLTHGIYNVKSEFVELTLNRVRELISRYDESNKWNNIISNILNSFEFNGNMSLESERVFSSYISKVERKQGFS